MSFRCLLVFFLTAVIVASVASDAGGQRRRGAWRRRPFGAGKLGKWRVRRPEQNRIQKETAAATTEKKAAVIEPIVKLETINKTQDLEDSERKGRFLSLFTVVRFNNDACTASTGDNGTCYSSTECSNNGGTGSGGCAAGFGVCCIFTKTCGSTTSQNCTYFVNNNYPSTYNGIGSCQLTVNKCNSNICQLRLDFENFNVNSPDTTNNNMCSNDQFMVSGGAPSPIICGTNSGNQMYVDVGAGTNSPCVLNMMTSGPSFDRSWKIKVSQIPCNSLIAAESGCTQYYTGVSGRIMSYNFDAANGEQISNQDYTICIRMERNFCSVQYTVCADSTNTPSQAFSISGDATANPTAAPSFGDGTCNTDWITIPCLSDTVNSATQSSNDMCIDRICGTAFNSITAATGSNVDLYSSVKPFRLTYHTDANETPDTSNRGFCLDYIQQPCTNR